jgi:2-oxoglutarate ferredoxin oxidoreductase subunit beta
MTEVLTRKGFSFIEIISACPTLYQRRNGMGDGLDAMKYYKEHGKTKHGTPTSELELEKLGDFIIGKFVDKEKPEYCEMMRKHYESKLGGNYVQRTQCQ